MIPTRRLVASLVFVGILVLISVVLWLTGTRPVLGLDLRGGIRVVLTAPEGTPQDVMERAGESIRTRVDSLGVAEPDLVVSGRNIEVQIPGTSQGSVEQRGKQYCVVGGDGKDVGCLETPEAAEAVLQSTGQQRLIDLIGRTARLEQREVTGAIPKMSLPETDVPGAAAVPGPNPEFEETELTCATEAERLTEACSYEALKDQNVVFLSEDGSTKFKLGPVRLSGDAISSALAQRDVDGSRGGGWFLSFELTADGSKTFSELTKQMVGKELAIVVDQSVLSAPTVRGQIVGGGEITGDFTEDETRDLATALNAGSLPVNLAKSEVVTVSATLGTASLQQGLIAGLVGLIALMLYLLFYYRLLGLVTWVGMAIWATLALGIVSILGQTVGYSLTLAGVAGFVVALGITADSYIVFFERLKDEVRNGKTPRTAIVPGFRRAWKTILAADFVTLLAAAILYLLAISSVRGFALTLGISVLLDMFVVYFYKRPTLFLMARSKRLITRKTLGFHEEDAVSPARGKRTASPAAEGADA